MKLEELKDFIDRKFNTDLTFDIQLKNLKLLSNKLKGIYITSEEIVALINSSPLLFSSLEFLYKMSINEVFKDKRDILIDTYFENSRINSLFDVYFKMNNIDVRDWIEFDNKDLISKDELSNLIIKAQNGDKTALNIIIESNVDLVKFIARRYIHFFSGNSFDDLVQEGMLGLVRAVEKYKFDKGASFSTYASWWIRQGILRLLDSNDRLISGYSVKNEGRIRKIHKVEDYLKQNNYQVTPELIAEYSGFDLDEVVKLMKMDIDGKHTSLDAPFNQESDESNFNFVIQNVSELEDTVIDKVYTEKIFDLAEHVLSKRDYEILCYRMGKYGRVYYLDEIASKYGLTHERIRQIEASTLKKLKTILSDLYEETDVPNKTRKNKSINIKTGIYKYFNNITYEELDEAMKMLKYKYQNIITDLFTTSLDYLNSTDLYKLSYFENTILPILKSIINLNRLDKINILSYFRKYTYEEITIAVEELNDEEKILLFGKFGKKFESNRHYGHKKISILYNKVFPKLNSILEYNRLITDSELPVFKSKM